MTDKQIQKTDLEVLADSIAPNGFFPNNLDLPLVLFKNAFDVSEIKKGTFIADTFKINRWSNTWKDGIYNFHHFHSNTHEVMGVFKGHGKAEFGGPGKVIHELQTGDVIIIPAGVAHKCISATSDFKCVGAYPFGITYDLRHGISNEYEESVRNTKKALFPDMDPVFGKNGLLFDYWFNL